MIENNGTTPKRSLTLSDVEAAIKSKEFSKLGQKTSVCLVTLQNGYEIVGASSCVDPANYNQEIRNEYALKKCIDQIWMLEGYLLQSQLA